MTLLSKYRPLFKSMALARTTGIQRAMSEHRVLPMQPSRWQWRKFKDLLHLYFMIGGIPCTLFIGYHNLFTGPATLSEIPEGYVPKYWEYCKNPVTRFLARYVCRDPQQEYEKYLCYLYAEQERVKLRQLEEKIKNLIDKRRDYQAFYFRPIAMKYYKVVRESSDKIKDLDDPIAKVD